MGNFSLGLIVGTAIGVGVIMSVNPMDKRAKRRMCRKANHIMNKVSHSIRTMS